MKITINADQGFSDAESHSSLYNCIKRSQEDLKRRFPMLKEFKLEFKIPKVFTPRVDSVSSRYNVSEDETVIAVIVEYLHKPTLEKVCKMITNEIGKIKFEYGYD